MILNFHIGGAALVAFGSLKLLTPSALPGILRRSSFPRGARIYILINMIMIPAAVIAQRSTQMAIR
jgi:hypothetical protein